MQGTQLSVKFRSATIFQYDQSLIVQLVKNPPAMQETPVRFLSWEDPLEKGQAYSLQYPWASLVAQVVKNLPAMWETWVRSLGWEDPLEKGKSTHSSVLAWRIPWTVQSMKFFRPEYFSRQPFLSPGDLPSPGIEPRSSALQAESLPAEPQGKPQNTGVSSLSLLQKIFLTQESNQCLLHCRRILYQLSYQGSPYVCTYITYCEFFWCFSGRKSICQCKRHGFDPWVWKIP